MFTWIQLLLVEVVQVLHRLPFEVRVRWMLPGVLVGSIALHRIHELRWPRTREDRQEQDRREPMAMILGGERAGVPGPEVSRSKTSSDPSTGLSFGEGSR